MESSIFAVLSHKAIDLIDRTIKYLINISLKKKVKLYV